MNKNPNIYVPKLPSEEIAPGYVLGYLAFFMGLHVGYFQIWVIINPENGEYNTAVSIRGSSNLGISDEIAEEFNANGITFNDKELETILKLFSSKRFKTFTESVPPYKYNDSGESILSIRSSNKKVYLSAENFNFYRRDKLCHSTFHWKCLWWTRGLKHIITRLQRKNDKA